MRDKAGILERPPRMYVILLQHVERIYATDLVYSGSMFEEVWCLPKPERESHSAKAVADDGC
jgi:hypothetical protein